MVKKKSGSETLSKQVLKGIPEKKGRNIISLDLRSIENAVAAFFIICHGTSRPQIEAIADGVVETVDKELGIDPWHKEGIENAEWILLDYVDVVVHIFEESRRDFYKLEALWADAKKKSYENID